MKNRGSLTIVVACLGLVCLLYVGMRIDLLRVGYDIERLEKKKAELERQHEFLQSRFSQLTSPPRIAKEAVKKLGLQIPKPGQIVMVTFEPTLPGHEVTADEPMQLVQRSFDAHEIK